MANLWIFYEFIDFPYQDIIHSWECYYRFMCFLQTERILLHHGCVAISNICSRAQTNVGIFECSFVYVTFVSRFFALKHLLIVFMPNLCANFIQKVPLLL